MKLKSNAKISIATFVAIAMTLGVALSGCASNGSTAKSSDSKGLIEITTYTRTDCTSTPIYVADKEGFFKAEGLKLKLTGTLKPQQILSSVISGQNDFADDHPNAIAMDIKNGAQIKGAARSIIEPPASVDPKYRHMWYFVKKGSPIKTWTDLRNYNKGQQITINAIPPSCTTFIPNVIFDKYGIGRDRLKFVSFDTDQEALQAVEQGKLDIAQVHPPFYNLAEQSGDLTKIGDSSGAGIGEAAGLYLYYFTDKFIAAHPDVVQKFVNAVTKAQVWANKNPQQALDITSKATGVTATGTHYYSENTVITDDEVQPWIDDLVKGGFLKKGELTPDNIVTHKFEVK